MAAHESICEAFSSVLAIQVAMGMLLMYFAAGSERPKDGGYRHVKKSKRNEKLNIKT